MSTQNANGALITIKTLKEMKQRGEKFVCVTAYDYCSAHAINTAGIETILVGDSLGMVIQGHDSSLPVTIEDMSYHVACVKRGSGNAMLIADLPFMSYYTEEIGLANAATLMRQGAHMIKIEGGVWIAKMTGLLSQRGIPVCAHIGLTPQSVNHLGGYMVQGRNAEQGEAIVQEAQMLEKAGASMLLVECVPSNLGQRLAETLSIPVIGIGAGPDTDAQVLVWHDLLGLYPGKKAKFVKNFLAENNEGIHGALTAFKTAVKSGQFPDAAHSYQ